MTNLSTSETLKQKEKELENSFSTLISVHPETLVFEAPELLVKEYFS